MNNNSVPPLETDFLMPPQLESPITPAINLPAPPTKQKETTHEKRKQQEKPEQDGRKRKNEKKENETKRRRKSTTPITPAQVDTSDFDTSDGRLRHNK